MSFRNINVNFPFVDYPPPHHAREEEGDFFFINPSL